MVTNTHDVKLGRWLAGKLMKELTLVSCQTRKHQYNRGGNERIDIPNLLNRQFAVIAKRHYFDNSQLCFFAAYQGIGCNHF